ncbi:MAG TPA: ORF6N domain-containing protein [Chitinophagaceae bacterium]
MAKAKQKITKVIPEETIIRKIFVFRKHKVMLDFDLADLYNIKTKVLNQAVKRNIARFPTDFMFRLTTKEWQSIRSHFVTASDKPVMRSQNETASQKKRNITQTPYTFTEQGVAMLSGVVNSDKAVKMNVAIMRAFVEIRRAVMNHKSIAGKLKSLEERLGEHDAQLNKIYDAIENLLDKKVGEEKWQERRRIGFKQK